MFPQSLLGVPTNLYIRKQLVLGRAPKETTQNIYDKVEIPKVPLRRP